MRRYSVLFLLVNVVFTCCQKEYSLKPGNSTTFIKFYGGFDSEKSYAALQTSDGGFICAGTTHSFGNGGNDIYLLKTDSNGNKEWHQTLGGTGNDEGKALQLLPNGNILLLGEYTGQSGTSDVYLACLDQRGSLQWSKNYGSASLNEKAFALLITQNQQIQMVGTIQQTDGSSTMYLIRTDMQGKMLWEKTYGLLGLKDELSGLKETTQGNLVLCGSEHRYRTGDSQESSDMRVILTQPEGNLLWDKNFGTENMETGSDIELTDNGFIALGTVENTATSQADICLVKLLNDGNLAWTKIIQKDHSKEFGNSIALTSDGGYIITGSIENAGNEKDIYLVKTDRYGQELWSRNFGGKFEDSGSIARQTADGGYMVFGTITFENNTMLCLIKTDAQGEFTGE